MNDQPVSTVSSVKWYDEDTQQFYVNLFDDADKANKYYFVLSRYHKHVSLKHNLPPRTNLAGYGLVDLEIGDEVIVISPDYYDHSVTGVVIRKSNSDVEILVSKQCREAGRSATICVPTNSTKNTILKTGNHLYAIAKYVS